MNGRRVRRKNRSLLHIVISVVIHFMRVMLYTLWTAAFVRSV
nr:MAG TPA: hypothetical protein [Caudoviricetes sp.]